MSMSMRNKKRILLMLFVVLCCCACDLFYDSGFPSIVILPKEGGETILKGDAYIGSLRISSYNTNEGESSVVNDTDYSREVTYLWLRATVFANNPNEIHISSLPNTTSKSRKLELKISSGPYFDFIKVQQN